MHLCAQLFKAPDRQLIAVILPTQAEVRQYEPWSALDGGQGSGCSALTAICHGAVDMLQPGGFLALETNGGPQAHAVAAMLRDHVTVGRPAFADVRVVADIFGVDRFVTAART